MRKHFPALPATQLSQLLGFTVQTYSDGAQNTPGYDQHIIL